ncbi:hypothetical protein D9611_014073 [Ephemerocybe angulata]|uniref:Uncharacterized protein n=1 Tax=Ephemerocybe angulata TaxID=980116 RepID=A0A8H5ASX7_9AGAR|nr:hypothetical protein D9611_014073 [Tulosesus angulatus]
MPSDTQQNSFHPVSRMPRNPSFIGTATNLTATTTSSCGGRSPDAVDWVVGVGIDAVAAQPRFPDLQKS